MRTIGMFLIFMLVCSVVVAEELIVLYKPDNSVRVLYPCKDISMEEIYKQSTDGTELEGCPYDIIERSDLPSTREHRNYWKGTKGQGITVNMQKYNADKQIAKDKKDKFKQKLGLTDAELIELKEVLNG